MCCITIKQFLISVENYAVFGVIIVIILS